MPEPQLSQFAANPSQLAANRPKKRGFGRPFAKGQSGNPGGKKKDPLNVQELARTHTVEAVEALVRGLKDPKQYIAAANSLLERGWGRPTQVIVGDDTRPIAISFDWAPAQQQQPHNGDALDARDLTLQIAFSDDDAATE